ncbi:MAG: accessory factor UbiK family protein [Pseudomonadota bacterium]
MQTQSPFFDQIARLMTETAGAADGVRREFETLAASQAKRLIADLDLAEREELDVLRDVAAAARVETEALRARVEALETRLAEIEASAGR